MLSLQPSPSSHNLTPNLLPCKITHSGPLPMSKRHWNPQTSSSSTNTPISHLRGRKLRGRAIKLPKGYQGFLAKKTEKVLPSTAAARQGGEDEDMDGEEEGERAEVKVMETKGTFEEIVVWGHEVVPQGEDPYVKGIEEWIAFAESVSYGKKIWYRGYNADERNR